MTKRSPRDVDQTYQADPESGIPHYILRTEIGAGLVMFKCKDCLRSRANSDQILHEKGCPHRDE